MELLRRRMQALSATQRARYDSIADDFDAEWLVHPDSPPDLSSRLPPEEPLRTLLLVALVKTDLEARRRRQEPIRVEDYLARHPELSTDAAAQVELVAWEYGLTQPEGGAAEDYCRRFPHLADVLRPLLTQQVAPSWSVPPGYVDAREIGRGGMGVVYLARHERLKRSVALKVLSAGLFRDETARTRFRREAEIVAALHHPNVVEIYEVGEHDSQPFCALEYCPGGSLLDRLRNAPLEPREAAKLLATLARAVKAAHDRGVVHRDLKPANVLLAANGTPRIADFGLARRTDDAELTDTGDMVGTLNYMPPEQAQGELREVGASADVYALGATLYHCLTGLPPFRGATKAETLHKVLNQDPVRPGRLATIPRDLETVCLKCLEKEPGKRYASAGELADDLERYLDGRPIHARPAGLLERAFKWTRRRPAAALALFLAVAAPSAVAGVATWYGMRLQAETDQAKLARGQAETRRQQAVQAADALGEQVARGVEPIAGTRSATVRQILDAARRIYDNLLQTDPSADVRAGDGRLHNRSAAIYLKMNDSERAQAEADAGLAAFQRLVEEDPSNPTYQMGLADSHEVRGRVALVREDVAAAREEFRACHDLRAALLATHSEDAELKAGLATAHVWTGTVLQAQGKMADARAEYLQALTLRSQLAGSTIATAPPDRQRDVADAHERLGNLALQNKELNEAAEHLQQAREILEPLARVDTFDTSVRKSLERVRVTLADTDLLLRHTAEGVALLETARPGVEQGLSRDPDDLDWQLLWFRTHSGLALAQFQGSGGKETLTAQARTFQELVGYGENLVKKDPHNHILQAEEAANEMALAAVFSRLGTLGEAPAENFRRAVEVQTSAVQRLTALTRADPSNREWSEGLRQAQQILEFLRMRRAGASAPQEKLTSPASPDTSPPR